MITNSFNAVLEDVKNKQENRSTYKVNKNNTTISTCLYTNNLYVLHTGSGILVKTVAETSNISSNGLV